MNKITYIKTSWCPYCRVAERMITKLQKKDERYRDIEIEIIDEEANPEKASQYQYELVPNFWVNGKKVLEGVPKNDTVKAVLEAALEDTGHREEVQEEPGE